MSSEAEKCLHRRPIAEVTSPRIADQTVLSGYTYYYVTTAMDSQGVESSYSNEAVTTVP